MIPAVKKIIWLRDQEDTAAAIVAGTVLEGALERGLARRMRRMSAREHNELFHSGPLRNFHPKIVLGQALNLFGNETAMEMRTLGDIRNTFAHTVKNITFETDTVKKLCFQLKRSELPAPPLFPISLVKGKIDGSSLSDYLDRESKVSSIGAIKVSPKLRYLYSAMMLVFMFEGIENDHPKRSRAPWPGFFS